MSQMAWAWGSITSVMLSLIVGAGARRPHPGNRSTIATSKITPAFELIKHPPGSAGPGNALEGPSSRSVMAGAGAARNNCRKAIASSAAAGECHAGAFRPPPRRRPAAGLLRAGLRGRARHRQRPSLAPGLDARDPLGRVGPG